MEQKSGDIKRVSGYRDMMMSVIFHARWRTIYFAYYTGIQHSPFKRPTLFLVGEN